MNKVITYLILFTDAKSCNNGWKQENILWKQDLTEFFWGVGVELLNETT